MYKPCHQVDWFKSEDNSIVPISTTHEMLKSGCKKERYVKIAAKKQMNFLSYVINEYPTTTRQSVPLITTYTRDYPAYNYVCLPRKEKEIIPDPLFNRKPPNLFDKSKITVYKFLDDHKTNISEERKKSDFMRQARNVHYRFV